MRFVADENFNNDILRGLKRHYPDLDVVRVQDTEIYEADDPVVLEWAAQTGRILLTHDAKTMPMFVYERIEAGLSTPGIFVINDERGVGEVIVELQMVIEGSDKSEWENLVTYLPFPTKTKT